MAQKDRELIRFSGFKISELATILHRSRQSIHVGIADTGKQYFSDHEVLAIYMAAKSRDYPRIDYLEAFIKEFYSKDGNLVLPETGSIHQFLVASESADSLALFTYDVNELLADAPYASNVIEAAAKTNTLTIWSSRAHIRNCELFLSTLLLSDETRVEVQEHDAVEVLPSLIFLTSSTGETPVRGFLFGADALQELPNKDVVRLWPVLPDGKMRRSARQRFAGRARRRT